MQSIYWVLGLFVVMVITIFFLMEQRWRKRLEKIKMESSSQPMWALMQQQMEQLRGQMGDGLNKNISLLTEQLRAETITKDMSFGEEKGILNYALAKRVMPVSPNSFYAYLQVIIFGLKGLQIEKDALKIQASLSGLKKDIGGFHEDFQLVGRYLINALNRFEEARRRLDKFNLKLDQIESQPSLPFKEK